MGNDLRRLIINNNREGNGLLARFPVDVASYRIVVLPVLKVVVVSIFRQIDRLPAAGRKIVGEEVALYIIIGFPRFIFSIAVNRSAVGVCHRMIGFFGTTEHTEDWMDQLISKLTACNRYFISACSVHIAGDQIYAKRVACPVIIDQIHSARIVGGRSGLIIKC